MADCTAKGGRGVLQGCWNFDSGIGLESSLQERAYSEAQGHEVMLNHWVANVLGAGSLSCPFSQPRLFPF